MNHHEVAFTFAQAFSTLWGGRWVPEYVLYGEIDPLLRVASTRPCSVGWADVLLMGGLELSRLELARRAAPVCYALRKARRPRLPSRCGDSRSCEPAPSGLQGSNDSAVVGGRTRVCYPCRVDAHRARLAARGLRCKASPFVPKDFIFVGPGDGWVPAKRGRRGRKALRAVTRGRMDSLHALSPVSSERFTDGRRGGLFANVVGVISTAAAARNSVPTFSIHNVDDA